MIANEIKKLKEEEKDLCQNEEQKENQDEEKKENQDKEEAEKINEINQINKEDKQINEKEAKQEEKKEINNHKTYWKEEYAILQACLTREENKGCEISLDDDDITAILPTALNTNFSNNNLNCNLQPFEFINNQPFTCLSNLNLEESLMDEIVENFGAESIWGGETGELKAEINIMWFSKCGSKEYKTELFKAINDSFFHHL